MNIKKQKILIALIGCLVCGFVICSSPTTTDAKKRSMTDDMLIFDIGSSYKGKCDVTFFDKNMNKINSLSEKHKFSFDKFINLSKKREKGAVYMKIYAGAAGDGKAERLIGSKIPIVCNITKQGVVTEVINSGIIHYKGALGSTAYFTYEFRDGSYGERKI